MAHIEPDKKPASSSPTENYFSRNDDQPTTCITELHTIISHPRVSMVIRKQHK